MKEPNDKRDGSETPKRPSLADTLRLYGVQIDPLAPRGKARIVKRGTRRTDGPTGGCKRIV